MTLDGIVGEGLGLVVGQMFFFSSGKDIYVVPRYVSVLVPASYYFGRTPSRIYI